MAYGKNDKLMVIDFDNTLFFTDACATRASKDFFGMELTPLQIRALEKHKKHELYLLAFKKYWALSKPNKAMIKKISSSKSAKKVLLTAKLPQSRERIEMLLAKNNINLDREIFRPMKYMLDHDEEWKLRELKKLAPKYAHIEFYEDKEDNIKYMKENLTHKNIDYFLVSKDGIKPIA